jgi:transcriptional regulator with XRE-family HTH domain
VEALMAQCELEPDNARSNVIDQGIVGVPVIKHGPLYQQHVDTSSPFSFIALSLMLAQSRGMTFGERLMAAIEASSYKNQRAFAIDGLGWDEASGPQRLSNYIKKNRVPRHDTLQKIAAALKTTPQALINGNADAALKDILLRLFELADIPADTADTLATAFLAAKRLHETYPEDVEPRQRVRLAAHSAWHLQPPLARGT